MQFGNHVFDDVFSSIHVMLGVVGYFIPAILVPYFLYQVISSKIKKEHIYNTLGDIVEFLVGTAVAFYISVLVSLAFEVMLWAIMKIVN